MKRCYFECWGQVLKHFRHVHVYTHTLHVYIHVHVYPHVTCTYTCTVRVKKTFNGAPVPVQPPYMPHSAPVQAPFVIIGSPVRVLCGLPVFCTTEFLARAKLKSKAKKTIYREARKYAKKYLEVSDARARFEPLTVCCDRKGGGAARVR